MSELSSFSQSKGDSPSQPTYQAQSVFDEDLQKKIQENERLHIQVKNKEINEAKVQRVLLMQL